MTGTPLALYRAFLVATAAAFLVQVMLFCFVLPPFQAPDEPQHWVTALFRSEQLFHPSVENFCNQPANLPLHFETKRIAFHPGQATRMDAFTAQPRMDPMCVSPQEIMPGTSAFNYPSTLLMRILGGRWEEDPDGQSVFLYARFLGGLMVFFAFLRLLSLFWQESAVRTHFFGQYLIPFFWVTPLLVQQSSAISYDGCIMVFCALGTGALLFPQRQTLGDRIALLVFALLTAVTKPVYVPLMAAALVVWVLCQKSLGTWASWREAVRSRATRIGFGALGFLSIAGIWRLIAAKQALRFTPTQQAFQANFVGQHPLEWLSMATRGIFMFFPSLTSFLAHGHLGWLDTPVLPALDSWSNTLVLLVLFELGVAALSWKDLRALALKHRGPLSLGVLVTLGGVILCCYAIALAMWTTWTQPGSQNVDGMQVRYFLAPMLLVLCLPRFTGALLRDPAEPEVVHPEKIARGLRIAQSVAASGLMLGLVVWLPMVAKVLLVRFH